MTRDPIIRQLTLLGAYPQGMNCLVIGERIIFVQRGEIVTGTVVDHDEYPRGYFTWDQLELSVDDLREVLSFVLEIA